MAPGTATREGAAQDGADGALRLGVVGAGHFGRYHAQKVAASTAPAWSRSPTSMRSAPPPSPARSAPMPWPTTTR